MRRYQAQFEELKAQHTDYQKELVQARGKLDARKKLLRKSELTLEAPFYLSHTRTHALSLSRPLTPTLTRSRALHSYP